MADKKRYEVVLWSESDGTAFVSFTVKAKGKKSALKKSYKKVRKWCCENNFHDDYYLQDRDHIRQIH